MSEKLNHSDLSALLAKEAEISIAKAETFTKAMFDLIIEGLEQDGIVKINGLGTFKILEVADRYSVNVNTGEKFEIKGHKKLTFTPAETLKESVNQPFAMFEPVEVDDNYKDEEPVVDQTEEQEDAVLNEESPTNYEDSVKVLPEIANEPSTEAPLAEPKEEATPIADSETRECAAESTPAESEPEKSADTAADDSATTEQLPTATETEEVADTPSPAQEESGTTAKEASVNEERPQTTDGKLPSRKGSGLKVLITFIILVVISAVLYLFIDKNNTTEKETSIQSVDTLDKAVVPESEPATTVYAPVEEADTAETDSTITVTQSTEENTYTFTLADELAARNDKSINDADTTLYTIKGEWRVHVVAENERLAKISNDYYGSRKLWPYIAKFNNLKKPYGLAIGMELRIPELQPK